MHFVSIQPLLCDYLSYVTTCHCSLGKSTKTGLPILGKNQKYPRRAHNIRVDRGAVVIIWQLDLQLLMQSVPITTRIVGSNPAHGEMYLIQHYVLKVVNDLWQVDGFSGYSENRVHPDTKVKYIPFKVQSSTI